MSSLADTGAYLDQLYQEKFGRAPDAAGKAYWKAELDSGKTSADQVAALFDSSDEAKQIKADKEAETQQFIEDTYKIELDREPDTAGANYWAEQINSGAQTQQEVVDNFRRSNEYEKWLRDVYQDELGRELGDEGRDYWLDDIEGGQTREDVLANIKRSEEYACAQSGGTWDGSSCDTSDDPIDCPAGQQLNSAGDGCIDIPEIPDDVCPMGTRKNAAGDCEAIPGPVPDGPDPDDPDPDDPGDGGGSNDGGTQVEYDDALNKNKEKYAQLESDYDDARREADSYINAQRADETSQLTRGFNVGSFPGRRRGDLTSGATATSDRSRKRSRITAGPRVREDRPYARAGLRSGEERGSTYFDPSSSFR